MLPTRNALIRVEPTPRGVHVHYRDREWLFPADDCILLPIENTTAELLARYLGQRLLDVFEREYRFRPDALRVEVEESPGQSATFEWRRSPGSYNLPEEPCRPLPERGSAMTGRMLSHSLLTVILAGLVSAGPAVADEAKEGPDVFKRLKYRSIGPAVGGRVCRACGVPGNPRTYYAACSMGGVWKSSDGGHTWKPIFDDQPVSSCGSIAVAPSDPNVIYVGSGEANIRGNVAAGNGIYKSEDAGKTWKHVWKQEGQIGTMIVHPKDPNIAYAAVFGKAFGPNEERGVYRTTDGGKTWKRVLFRDKDSGASDVSLDLKAPKVLFAGMWQARRTPWSLTSGGPGSGLFTSRDGGDTWTELVSPPPPDSDDASRPAPPGKKYCKGLPRGEWGKVGVAVAPSDGRRVYAMIEADKGGLFLSDDGGETWKHVNDHHALRQRAWYYSTITVDPTNPDVIWCPQVPLLKSIDAGDTFHRAGDGKANQTHHGDHHDVWIDPKDPKRVIDSNDGGVDISLDGGKTWFAPPLPIAQFYHIDVDNSAPYRVMGSMQDIGTGSGPSNSLNMSGIRLSDWFVIGGGEAGHVVADPSDPNIVYAGEYGGYLSRYDNRTGQSRNVSVYPFNPSGFAAKDVKYRFQWTAPILISPHDSKVVYHAGNVLFRSPDGGKTWAAISHDLTRDDKSKQEWSGGPITGDNTGAEVYCTIFAIAESPVQKGLLWAGSDDGLVHVTRDGGKQWMNVTEHVKGIPKWATVRCIEPSPIEAGTAYLVVDAHRLDDPKPYLYKTVDFGETWTSLTADLPKDVFLHVVRVDPKKKGMLYLGTEKGVRYSTDDGKTWRALKLNLPTVAISDLKVKGNDLVLGTNGRSIWVLDDLTLMREMSDEVTREDVHLFPVQPVIGWRLSEKLDTKFFGKGFENPPPGAIVHYSLKRGTKREVLLEVFDEKGEKVRTLSSKEEDPPKRVVPDEGNYAKERPKPVKLSAEPGLHRVVWDLRHVGAELIKNARLDAGLPEVGPLVLPGKYTLKLTFEGKAVSRVVEVRTDLRVHDPGESLVEQLTLALKVRDDITRLAKVVTQLRSLRQQITARDELLKENDAAGTLLKEDKVLLERLEALEEKLHNPRAEVTYDILAQRGGAKLYSQLSWLLEALKEGDGAPSHGVREQYAEQSRLFAEYEKEWEQLLGREVAKVNQTAKNLSVPGLIVPRADARRK
ncbi:MAG: hypothetical protein HYS12_06955, partial [Planctomycetes bacterium]|nr:hypothetical protein [Planctomycetota bacterium]